MKFSAQDVAKLRSMTGISMGKCKEALEAAAGNIDQAIDELRKSGMKAADKRLGRETGEGAIISYIHGHNKMGVLIQLGCETDFVAKNEEFIELGRNLAMHIIANSPKYISPDDVSDEEVTKELEIYRAQLENEHKPAEIMEKILAGKVKKFREENALLSQNYVKDPSLTVGDVLTAMIAKMGENIQVIDFKKMVV